MTTFKVATTTSWSLSLSGEWISWNSLRRKVSNKFNVLEVHRLFQTMIIHNVYQHLSLWINAQPDLLNLSGKAISLKLKFPTTWIEGSFFFVYFFMLVPSMVKQISVQLEFFTRLPILTCHIMRSFVCKHFNPNWLRVDFQFRDGHMWDILVNK